MFGQFQAATRGASDFTAAVRLLLSNKRGGRMGLISGTINTFNARERRRSATKQNPGVYHWLQKLQSINRRHIKHLSGGLVLFSNDKLKLVISRSATVFDSRNQNFQLLARHENFCNQK